MTATVTSKRPQTTPDTAPWIVARQADVVRFFRVSRSTVDEWQKAGMPGRPGRWDLSEIVAWKAARARDPETTAAADGSAAEWLARRRKAEALLAEHKAEAMRIDNAERAGGLVPRGDVLQEASMAFANVKERLLACPQEMEMRFPAETRIDNTRDFEEFIYRVLKELASWADNPIEETTADAK